MPKESNYGRGKVTGEDKDWQGLQTYQTEIHSLYIHQLEIPSLLAID